jgi:hypothetical protein
MIRRTAAAGLLLLAGTAYLTLVVPARRETDEARAECARAREQRQRLRERVADLERRAVAAGRAPAGDAAAAARALRGSFLRATTGLPVEAVQIAVNPGERGALAARGRLVAEGRLADLLRLATRLTAPSSGLLVERVGLAETRTKVRLEVEGFSAGEDS